MNAVTKEKINQIVSRTDVTGNERADLIEEFAKEYAIQFGAELFAEDKNITVEKSKGFVKNFYDHFSLNR